MKIIAHSNFNIESISEYLVAEGISNIEYAQTMVRALNDKFSGDWGSYHYRVVPDDHKLWRGMEELV